MKTEIAGKPVFAYGHVDLEPGESIIAESNAMASMDADLDMQANFNGGLLSALCKRFLGGESLFVNTFTNNTDAVKRVTLVQSTPGDMNELELKDESYCFQPGAYICSTPGVKLGVKWAGIGSFIAREGLFKLQVSGTGTVWFGAYGGLIEKNIDGEFIVDTNHLVGYEPNFKLKTQLAGGNIFSSFLSGEGLVTRVVGTGKIILQTRSISGLSSWLNRNI